MQSLVIVMSLTSCAASGQETKANTLESAKSTTVVVDSACDWVQPIWISKSDVLTAETARQIYNHNESVNAACKDKLKVDGGVP
jgi:hypothetical protein